MSKLGGNMSSNISDEKKELIEKAVKYAREKGYLIMSIGEEGLSCLDNRMSSCIVPFFMFEEN